MYPNTECPHDCYKPGDCDGSCTHPRPVVAPQQPRAVSEKSIQTSDTRKVDAFRNMFAILHNTGLADLTTAGVITEANPLRLWDRFNDDLTTFVLKLDDARLDALYALVQAKQPERYRDAA